MIHVAIVGIGAISPAHIEAYKRFADLCEVTVLCDLDLKKAKEKAQDYGLKRVPVFKDIDEICADPEIDLVSICTPPSTHASIAVRLLKAGKHVLIEKPMAASLEECDLINQTAKEQNRIVSVIAQNRFFTPMMKVKQILDQQLIGKVLHSQVDSFWWRGNCYYDLWWRGTWEKEGGGCTLNHAVHHIDILQWMNGMPTEVTAIMSNTAHDNAEVEDLSVAILKYKDGSIAQITSSVVHHGEEQQIIFQGEKARISVPWRIHASTSSANGFPNKDSDTEQTINDLYENLPSVVHEAHLGQIHDVLLAIQGGTPVLVDGQQGRQTLELITAIYKSASEKKTVTLPLKADDSFYTKESILKNTIYFHEKTVSVDGFDTEDITTGGKYDQTT
ncbi:Gfo/Idh/MocA family protein [Alkalicoccobacillus plakortidis]|uniref:Gfo/Idh/MocA family oxidoreductase n=1 Tax=Alkalicoccobacillus plakortidis TaxID=444060 RepID=A0ABT0XN31_9BACI|nr:Gfo/Idh/MocA family oxidoreductase [Alkalicoccobacillus plakortidis]MCM2677311.1 Gfo/Idh/MocA family oxidoreductase [Alkalicoccobacillus plakortidis]